MKLSPPSPNLVAGANEVGYHLLNVNAGRDFTPDIVCDIAAAEQGSACPHRGGRDASRARRRDRQHLQAGHPSGSVAMGATFSNEDGVAQPVVMGSYGIGIRANMACIAEYPQRRPGACLACLRRTLPCT